MNISYWKQSTKYDQSRLPANQENSLIIYEIIEGYDTGYDLDGGGGGGGGSSDFSSNNRSSVRRKPANLLNNKLKQFFLLSAKDAVNGNRRLQEQYEASSTSALTQSNEVLDKTEINDLIRLLFKFEVFLLDVDLIKEISLNKKVNTDSIESSESESAVDNNKDMKFQQEDRVRKKKLISKEKKNRSLQPSQLFVPLMRMSRGHAPRPRRKILEGEKKKILANEIVEGNESILKDVYIVVGAVR